jgi:DNA replication protein DnaC
LKAQPERWTHPLWLSGPVGTGKTWRACGLLKGYLAKHREYARFVSVPELLARVRATYNVGKFASEVPTEQSIVAELVRQQLLVLDEVGQLRNGGRHELTILLAIVDGRMLAGKGDIVVTSNDSPEELRKRTRNNDDARRLLSRLQGMTRHEAMAGPDRRLG